MPAEATAEAICPKLGATDRSDAWWAGPLVTGLGLGGFVLYSTFRAIFNRDYMVELGGFDGSAHLLSPFYSPLIILPWLPPWFSPAFLILWAPGGFRVTCYYYRKAYYRSFFADPPACAVGESLGFKIPGRGLSYKGETRLLLFQNLHRYFMYLAVLFLFVLAWAVILACMWPSEGGGKTFGLSVATLVLAANVTLLSLYTCSCHSFRHLIGGKLNSFSRAGFGRPRYQMWKGVSALNQHHMLFAWMSLFMVGFADFYIWMVASGRLTDLRFF